MHQLCVFLVIGSQPIACSGCEAAIGRALGRMSGVLKVKADHQTQHIVVHLETSLLDANAVQDRLAAIGYQTNLLIR